MQLKVKNLNIAYGKKQIIDDLSIEFSMGKIVALIGPNGCGKSTFLKSIARLIQPKKGEILISEQNIKQFKFNAFSKILSFLPQQHFVPEGITVEELVGFGRSPYLNLWGSLGKTDKEIIKSVMEQTHITEMANQLVSDLSGGQRQRAFLAMVLAQNTPIILLDEPTTYLDLNHQIELMNIMRTQQQLGKTVIVVLHDLNQACRYCDYLFVMKNGQLKHHGKPDDVMTQALLWDIFDINGEIHRDPVCNTPMFIAK